MQQLEKLSFIKLFTASDLSLQSRLYYLFCFGMYFYNIYQNIQSCISFYKNTKCINKNFDEFEEYFDYTLCKIDDLIEKTNGLKSYNKYNNYLEENKKNIQNFMESIKSTPRFSINPLNIIKSGITMKQYYLLYDRKYIDDIFQFTFDFHSYLLLIKNFANKINHTLNPAQFINKDKPIIKFKKVIYPNIENTYKSSNDISIKNNKIITGPNASGKTTLLKATIINLLLCQQTGYGFFQSAKLHLSILIETMRREGFELSVGRPQVILKDIDGKVCEPFEDLTVDVQVQIHMKQSLLQIVILNIFLKIKMLNFY